MHIPAPDEPRRTEIDKVQSIVAVANAFGDTPSDGHCGKGPVCSHLQSDRVDMNELVHDHISSNQLHVKR